MNEGRTVFSQLLDCLPKYEFDKCVQRYRGNFRVRKLPSYEQFVVMAFAQLSWRESLRDIETCLRPLGSKLYQSGIPATVVARHVSRDSGAGQQERGWDSKPQRGDIRFSIMGHWCHSPTNGL